MAHDLARVVAEIVRLTVYPAELMIGDFIQRTPPHRALRLLAPPYLMGISNTYRLDGVSSIIGQDTMYRSADATVPIVRGVPFTPRLHLVVAERAERLAREPFRLPSGLSVPTPGGVA